MSSSDPGRRRDPLAWERTRRTLDVAERLLEASSTRIALSLLIIVSVLPERVQAALFPGAVASGLNLFFLAVFSLELLARLAVFARRWRRDRARSWEVALLVLDLLAVASFIPPAWLHGHVEPESFRLLRLTRMLLLLGYWGRPGRELILILAGPERRYQVAVVLLLGLLLSFGSAVLMANLEPRFDFDASGSYRSEEDQDFLHILWWSFRQVQDPGNLVQQVSPPVVVVLSLLLTFSGLLLFSLMIGIGSSAVEELLARSRAQPLRCQQHTVVLGLTPYSVYLLAGLAEIYRKNLRPFQVAVLGAQDEAPTYLHTPQLRSFLYRSGDPVRVADLDRVNVQQAKRVLLLGSDPGDPDGEVISAILAIRERNPGVPLYPDVEHERNFRAVRAAGGPRTHLVGSGSFLGYYVVQNVVYPEAYRFFRHLLDPAGCEIYTYIYPAEERQRLWTAAAGGGCDPRALHRLGYHGYGVTLLGLFLADEEGELEDEDLELVLNPLQRAAGADKHPAFDAAGKVSWTRVRGLVALALRWGDVRQLAHRLIAAPALKEAAAAAPPPSSALFSSVGLRSAHRRVRRVLLCGESLRIPRIVVELTGFYQRIEVTVAVREPERLHPLAQQVRRALSERWGAPAESRSGDVLELRLPEPGGDEVRITLLAAEWSDQERLREHGVVDLETADAILFLPGQRAELDGNVALDSLHLANLVHSGALRPRPGLHVLAMVRDPVKGDLLESRLAAIGAGGNPDSPSLDFTVVSSERARHLFIMQNVFVRGLNAVYLELLSSAGQQLGRLEPRDAGGGAPPSGSFDPAELAEHLLRERSLVFVGLELDDPPGHVRLELDPRQLAPGTTVLWSTVRAVFVLGTREDLLRPWL